VITSGTENPDNHSLVLEALIESFDQSILETIPMYDDGLHDDHTAGDGVFGTSWAVPSGERSYHIQIRTLSLESGYSNILQNAAVFTTIGPVVFNRYFDFDLRLGVFSQRFIFKISLQNLSPEMTVENLGATLKLPSEDSCYAITENYREHRNITPGEIVDGLQYYSVELDTSCLKGNALYVPFIVEIESDGYVLWEDTFSIDILSDITEEDFNRPKQFALDQNYPNPFNPLTIISYQLPTANDVELSIYNLLGEKIVTLVSERKAAGVHHTEWDASGFASGIYYYQIRSGDIRAVKKMILLR
jgi:hypothetical protein